MKIGLDISSNIIGYSIWDNNTLLKYGFIDISNINSDKLIDKVEIFMHLIDLNNITEIIIEESLKSFAYGKSSVNTILLLTKINSLISYAMYLHTNIYPKYISAQTARKNVGIIINKSVVDKKLLIFNHVNHIYNIVSIINKNNNLDKRMYDIADAIVVGSN